MNETQYTADHYKDLTGIFGEEYLTRLLKDLTDAWGIPFYIIDYKGNPVTSHISGDLFCKTRESQDRFFAQCQIAYALAAAKSAIQNIPYVFYCPDHLVNMAIPIIVKHQYMGALVGGPLLCLDEDTGQEIETVTAEMPDVELKPEALTCLPCFRIKAVAKTIFRLFTELGDRYSYNVDNQELDQARDEIRELKHQNRDLETKGEEMEILLLRSWFPKQLAQNLMTTISNYAILEDAPVTESLTTEFSSILRFYMGEKSGRISIKDELGQVEKYLGVLKNQFSDSFEYRLNCQPEMEDQKIPTFTMIPFVIYMMNRALSGKGVRGKLYVDAEQKDGRSVISIQMDGNRGGSKIGAITDENSVREMIEGCKKRLNMEYGTDYKLNVDRERTVMEFPFKV